MRYGTMLMAAVAVAVGSASLSAQTATANLSATVPVVMVMSSSGTFTFGTIGSAEYDAGKVAVSGPTITHRGNVPYKLTAQAGAANLGFTAAAGRSDANPNKPAGDITLTQTTDAANSSVALGAPASPADLYSRGARGTDKSTSVSAEMALSYANDPPGTYSTVVTFTMVAQ